MGCSNKAALQILSRIEKLKEHFHNIVRTLRISYELDSPWIMGIGTYFMGAMPSATVAF